MGPASPGSSGLYADNDRGKRREPCGMRCEACVHSLPRRGTSPPHAAAPHGRSGADARYGTRFADIAGRVATPWITLLWILSAPAPATADIWADATHETLRHRAQSKNCPLRGKAGLSVEYNRLTSVDLPASTDTGLRCNAARRAAQRAVRERGWPCIAAAQPGNAQARRQVPAEDAMHDRRDIIAGEAAAWLIMSVSGRLPASDSDHEGGAASAGAAGIASTGFGSSASNAPNSCASARPTLPDGTGWQRHTSPFAFTAASMSLNAQGFVRRSPVGAVADDAHGIRQAAMAGTSAAWIRGATEEFVEGDLPRCPFLTLPRGKLAQARPPMIEAH